MRISRVLPFHPHMVSHIRPHLLFILTLKCSAQLVEANRSFSRIGHYLNPLESLGLLDSSIPHLSSMRRNYFPPFILLYAGKIQTFFCTHTYYANFRRSSTTTHTSRHLLVGNSSSFCTPANSLHLILKIQREDLIESLKLSFFLMIRCGYRSSVLFGTEGRIDINLVF